MARLASVLQAANDARDGQPEKAMQVYDSVIRSGSDPQTLAYAWAYKGSSLYDLQKFDPAILAYLHVPVFYPEEKILLPAILLETGKCYVHIENLPEAQKAFNNLIEQYPSLPEAAAAKAELKKISPTTPDANASSSSTTPDSTSTPAATPASAPANPPATP